MRLHRRTALLLLAASLLPSAALAQWSPSAASNTAIADVSGEQAVSLIAASGDGSTWMAWFDNRGGSYAVYAQRLDPQGNETFAHGGLLVSGNPQSTSLQGWDMISDGAGGCVIAFTDTRNGPDLDVYAYRLDVAGNPLWGANGVTISSNTTSESNPVLALTTDGYFMCAWNDTPSPGPGAVRIQRLDGAGAPQYPLNGIAIVGGGTERPSFAQITASDAGSYIVSYTREFSATSGIRHLRTQKFDGTGNPLWNAGSPVSVYDQNSLPIAHQHQLRSDGAGGAVYAWHRSVGTNFEVMNQRVNSAGVEVFAHNGVSVCTDTTIELNPALSVEPTSGDAIIFFNKENGAQTMWSLSVQRISTAGALLWGGGLGIDLIPIDNVQKLILKSVPYADGAACCSFRSTGSVTHDLVNFRVDGSGNSVWGGPVVASSVVSGKLRNALATDASGVLRMVWTDNRNDVMPIFNGYDTYAQNVNANGSLGNVTTPSTSFCLGDGTGPACPCGNNATTPGRGCASATFPGGALLTATRQAGASNATDTLKLVATDIPGPGLFFQSNGIAGAPVALGDGQLCAAIGIIRLGVVFPTLGVATYPGGLTPNPIHIAGGPISAGDTKHYQCWYRSIPALCSASNNFDLTQGVTLTWGP